MNDHTGETFHRLTIVYYDRLETTPSGRRYHRWMCRCSCGNPALRSVRYSALRQGYVQSCGCLHSESSAAKAKVMGDNNLTHGHTVNRKWTPTYHSWAAMKRRCLDPNDRHYDYYGGRNITICPEWISSFEAFLRDMGARPEGKTLDRINSDGPYEKSNCQWSTPKEQQQNTRPRRRKAA